MQTKSPQLQALIEKLRLVKLTQFDKMLLDKLENTKVWHKVDFDQLNELKDKYLKEDDTTD